MPACTACTSTYSSRLDSRQAEGRRGEIEGRGVKDPAQVWAVSVNERTLACFLEMLTVGAVMKSVNSASRAAQRSRLGV